MAYLRNPSNFSLSLELPLNNDAMSSSSFSQTSLKSDTFLMLLLRLRCFQADVLELMIEKMVTFFSGNKEERVLSKTLFNHIRCCEVIFEAHKLTQSLFEIIPVIPLTMQIESISSLPSLISEQDAESTVLSLLELTSSSSELIPCVFETISNLSLSSLSPSFSSAVERAIELLSSAEVNYLPPLIRFLLDASNGSNVEEILIEVREKLSEFLDVSRDATGLTRTNNLSAETLIVGILRMSFMSRPLLFITLQKLLLSEDSANRCGPIDLWIMFALGSCLKSRSKLHTLIGKLVGTNKLTSEDIFNSISKASVPLETLFSSLLELAQSCLSSTRLGIICHHLQSFGRTLYQSVYQEFTSASHRQEVIARLVSHAGAPSKSEVDCTLQSLLAICDFSDRNLSHRGGEPTTLRSFLPFIKSLLDDLTSFTFEQNRVLFGILFRCTSQRADHFSVTSSMNDLDDMMILLRKLCVSTDIPRRKIALIGLVRYLLQASELDWTGDDCLKTFHYVFRQAKEDAATRVFLLDEFSLALSHINTSPPLVARSLLRHIDGLCTYIINSFTSHTLSSASNECEIGVESKYGLDTTDAAGVVNIFSGAFHEGKDSCVSLPSIDLLAPALKLLYLSTKLQGEGMERLLKLLPLALEVPTVDCLDRSEDFTLPSRSVICSTLRYSVKLSIAGMLTRI